MNRFMGFWIVNSALSLVTGVQLRIFRDYHFNVALDREGHPLVTCDALGTPGTANFTLAYYQGKHQVSPWHNVPVFRPDAMYNMVVEIPMNTTAKMEIQTRRPLNSIAQDTKDGQLRNYFAPIPWNYGAFPQTWEDPNEKGNIDVHHSVGDGDPLDAVELSGHQLEMGGIYPVKVLGALALLDSGELDWKILVLWKDSELAAQVNNMKDLEAARPGTIAAVKKWFKYYKTLAGSDKEVQFPNDYGYNGECLDNRQAENVILQTHAAYTSLLRGNVPRKGLWIGSD